MAHFLERLASFSRLIRFDKRGTGLSDRVSTRPPDSRGAHGRRPRGDGRGRLGAGRGVRALRGLDHGCSSRRRIPSERRRWCARRLREAPRPGRRLSLAAAGEDREEFAATRPHLGALPVGSGTTRRAASVTSARPRGLAHAPPAWREPGAAATLLRMNSTSTFGTSSPRSRSRRSSCIARAITRARRGGPVHGPTGSPVRGSSSSRARTTRSGSATWTRCSTRSRSFSPAPARRRTPIASWPPSSSPTSSARPSGRSRSAIVAGATCSGTHHARGRGVSSGRFRGREIHTTGDGFLAAFDGPARAVRCARRPAMPSGSSASMSAPASTPASVELTATKLPGIAVHTGARIGSLAGPGEVLVSQHGQGSRHRLRPRSSIAAPTHSRASRTRGSSTPPSESPPRASRSRWALRMRAPPALAVSSTAP